MPLGQAMNSRISEQAPGNSRVIFLRHDIDVSVSMAVTIANLELRWALEALILCWNSPLYNLLEDELSRYYRN